MNFRKIISCFLATAAICMTCSLTGCRKGDGEVGDKENHATDARHTDERRTDEHRTDAHGTDDHMTSATPAVTPTALP